MGSEMCIRDSASGANVPGVHAAHVAASALVLPVGPPVPAAQAVPLHAERKPAVAACVPAGHAVHTLVHRHWYDLLHVRLLLRSVLKYRDEPSMKQPGG